MTQNQSGKQLFEIIQGLPKNPQENVGYTVIRRQDYVFSRGEWHPAYRHTETLENPDEAVWLSPAQPSTGKPELFKDAKPVEGKYLSALNRASSKSFSPTPTRLDTGKQLPTDEEIEVKAAEECRDYDDTGRYSVNGHILNKNESQRWIDGAKWAFAQGESDKWIRVEDGLPEADGNYLIVFINSAGRHVGEAYFMEGMFWDDVDSQPQLYSFVSHWQPLPNAPINNNQK